MADVNLENAASPETQLGERERERERERETDVKQPEGIENGFSQCGRKSYAINKKLAVVCKMMSLLDTKQKSLENVECLCQ